MQKFTNFVPVGQLGKGGYGEVWQVTNAENTHTYALKINKTDKIVWGTSTLKELDVLIRCGSHPCISGLVGVLIGKPFPKYRNDDKKENLVIDQVCFVFEKAEYDLGLFTMDHERVEYKYKKQALVQMALAIEFLNSLGIIHRDIKTYNTLWFRRQETRWACLCDMGMARYHSTQTWGTKGLMTARIRAPEVELGDAYDEKIDVWSLGCVAYEIMCGSPIVPDKDDKDILECICEILPLENKIGFEEYDKQPNVERGEFEKIASLDVPENEKAKYCDWLSHLLVMDPEGRLSIREVLNHEFFSDQRHLIEKIRKKLPERPTSILQIPPDTYTSDTIRKMAKAIYENRAELAEWYSHRIPHFLISISYKLHDTLNVIKSTELYAYLVGLVYMGIKLYTMESFSYKEIWDALRPFLDLKKTGLKRKKFAEWELEIVEKLGGLIHQYTILDFLNDYVYEGDAYICSSEQNKQIFEKLLQAKESVDLRQIIAECCPDAKIGEQQKKTRNKSSILTRPANNKILTRVPVDTNTYIEWKQKDLGHLTMKH